MTKGYDIAVTATVTCWVHARGMNEADARYEAEERARETLAHAGFEAEELESEVDWDGEYESSCLSH